MVLSLILYRSPLDAPMLDAGVCILPVWDTGQLRLHCLHPSIHIKDITLVWWIKVRFLNKHTEFAEKYMAGVITAQG